MYSQRTGKYDDQKKTLFAGMAWSFSAKRFGSVHVHVQEKGDEKNAFRSEEQFDFRPLRGLLCGYYFMAQHKYLSRGCQHPAIVDSLGKWDMSGAVVRNI